MTGQTGVRSGNVVSGQAEVGSGNVVTGQTGVGSGNVMTGQTGGGSGNVVTGRTRNAVRTLRALLNMHSFSVQASFVWNNLPAHIRHSIFSHSSKRLLKRFP